jgi:CRP/FNR family transcriptional regulator, cyclic AMP receptor protein
MHDLDPMAAPLLEALAQRGGRRVFAAHTLLFNEGDHSDAMYVLLSGRVKVFGSDEDGREVIYNVLGPGETFGELALDGAGRSASVMTLSTCQCVLVPGQELRNFLAAQPDFALYLVHKLARLLRHSTQSVKRLALKDVYGRLRHLLLSQAEEGKEPEQADGGLVVPMRMTQQQMAEHVGASREMVSRVFSQWLRGGYLRMERERIVLLKKLPARW